VHPVEYAIEHTLIREQYNGPRGRIGGHRAEAKQRDIGSGKFSPEAGNGIAGKRRATLRSACRLRHRVMREPVITQSAAAAIGPAPAEHISANGDQEQ